MLSAVVPQATEWEPQALLPTMPPIVQRLCVEGSGAKVRPYFAVAFRSSPRMTPG